MAKIPKISDAEWEVMQVVWEAPPISASEVVERLGHTDWTDRTIKTMLGRLVQKGALAYSVKGNRYLYRPKVSRDKCLKQASQSFVNKVFGGDPGLLMAHFVENAELSPDELAELKRILADKEREAGN